MDFRSPQCPTLFLSHSGEQKGFVWNLYRELLHVKHSTFFDQDSGIDGLPKGSPFPSRILEACRECKLGVVVLSHDYIESLWPMLELQQFVFHNRNEPRSIYPIFYKLKPADLSSDENLKRWQSTWQEKKVSWDAKVQKLFMKAPSTSTSDPRPILDIKSWPEALEILRSQSGDTLPNNKDEHSFIQTIVSNICKRFPPPESLLMDSYFKGADYITQEIHKHFQEKEESRKENVCDRDTPVIVGMHGVGGSGKSTACNYMVNFYGKDYPGNCFCLEFPSREEAENKSLVQSIKKVLSARGTVAKDRLDSIQSVDQGMPYLKVFLRSYKVFLILDNVWDWAVPIVKQILTMEFVPESRLLVTSRSSRLLENLTKEEATILSAMKIIPIPSMSEEEAIQALMDYSCTTWYFNSRVDDLRGLARSCFFDGQCHPLLLIKGVGGKLRRLGGHKRSDQAWAQLISRLQADIKHGNGDIEKSVVSVLKTSYEQLHSELKDVFLKLGTCIPQFYFWYANTKLCEWLAMISSDGFPTVEYIRDQLIELEYYGLIEMQNDEVKLHDLQRMLMDNLWQENEVEPRRCLLFEGDRNGILTAASEISDDEWRRFKYIHANVRNSMICEIRERRWPSGCFSLHRRACMSPRWQCIEVLHLQKRRYEYGESAREVKSVDVRLSVKHMASLRHLVLRDLKKLTEVGGWHGASKLTSVKLINCGVQKVESMSCLSRLESLVISISCSSYSRIEQGRILKGANDLAEFLGHLPELRELDLSGFRNDWVNLGRLSDICPSLQRCNLRWAGICKFPSLNLMQLRVLDLGNCYSLQSMEGSMCSLTALEELCLDDCEKLERIPDLKLLVSLRVLTLRSCGALEEVKVGGAAPLTSLELRGCYALIEVKVGDAAVTSLKCLSLERETCCHLSTESCSPLPISAFTNLQRLTVECDGRRGELIFRMDLPVSLEHLELDELAIGKGIARLTSLTSLLNLKRLSLYFCAFLTNIDHDLPSALQMLQVSGCASLTGITGLSALPDLRELSVYACASLTSITGLGPLTKLERLHISGCESLREVGHWEPPFDRYKLRYVSVTGCPQLDMSVFPSHIRNMIT